MVQTLCKKCGSALPTDARFCDACGKPASDTHDKLPNPAASPPSIATTNTAPSAFAPAEQAIAVKPSGHSNSDLKPTSNTQPESKGGSIEPPAAAPNSRDSRETYATHVIVETHEGPPVLLEGESIEINAKHGFPPTMVVCSVFAFFAPPFVIWGLLALLILFTMRHQKKYNGVWVTNKRFVEFTKRVFSKNKYDVTSIPLGEIRDIRHSNASRLDRLFGVGDFEVFVKGSKVATCTILEIKSPGQIIKHILKVTNAKG